MASWRQRTMQEAAAQAAAVTPAVQYELQLLDCAAGLYRGAARGADPSELMKTARLSHDGPRRVVQVNRRDRYGRERAPLPLEAPKPLKHRRAPTRASCYDPGALLKRALAWYTARLEAGAPFVTVYTWKRYSGAPLWGYTLLGEARMLAAQYGVDRVRFVELDPREPGCAFGPLMEKTI